MSRGDKGKDSSTYKPSTIARPIPLVPPADGLAAVENCRRYESDGGRSTGYDNGFISEVEMHLLICVWQLKEVFRERENIRRERGN